MAEKAAPDRVRRAPLPTDPCAGGIADYAKRLRSGTITAEAATQAYLKRIEILEPAIQAFEHVAPNLAIAQARAIDKLLAAGTDLGPLMGVPATIKDILAVNGMPTTGGSNLNVEDLIGPEGSFVKSLRLQGVIFLGKVKTPEFAHGAGRFAMNLMRGTPTNPWDSKVLRVPGGSSSGSGASVCAGFCAFSVGSDTGASVRFPAAFQGLHGLKTTCGLWPTDGVFSLSSSFDSLGIIAPSARDEAYVFAAISGKPVHALPLRGLRLGKLGPVDHFFGGMEPDVQRSVDGALAALTKAGVSIEPVEFTEATDSWGYPEFIYAEYIASYGRERFAKERDRMDPFVSTSLADGLNVKADDYVRIGRRFVELNRLAHQKLQGFDAWITPTTVVLPPACTDFDDEAKASKLRPVGSRNTRFGSFMGLCASSSPIQMFGNSKLPVGLQIICGGYQEAHCLGIGLALETLTGLPPRPDLSGFFHD